MADIIRLPDGSTKICFDNPEVTLGELIEEKLGFDAKEIYDKVVTERNEAIQEYEKLLDSQEDDDGNEDDDDDFQSTPIFKTLCEELDKTSIPSSGGMSEDAMGSGGKTCIVRKGSAIWV